MVLVVTPQQEQALEYRDVPEQAEAYDGTGERVGGGVVTVTVLIGFSLSSSLTLLQATENVYLV